MRLHILSDLHLNYAPYRPMDALPLAVDADVVVLAGDLDDGTYGVRWAKQAFADKHVILVPGNHEFHHGCMPEVVAKMKEQAAGSNVHVLVNEEKIIDGVRFLGTTLWSDFEIEGQQWKEEAIRVAKRTMPDYRLIRKPDGAALQPEDTMRLHQQSREWLQMKLREGFDGKTVVVTHHGWSRQSIHPRYAGVLLNGAFASDMTELLGRCALVVHGHTHSSIQYEVEGTRVVVNPRGYCRSNVHETRPLGAPIVEKGENPDFDPNLVVEI